ncbi:MAG: hypothetical protein IJF15_05160 [Oscillospiraceae bacterium]|nr:hypothetical protein [Oscillospiraceae bacterium]
MKGSSVIGKLTMLFLALGVAVYFGVQGYLYAANPLTTTVAYTYAAQTTVALEGFVVREEAVIPSEGGLLRVVCAEGARVAAGETIATVYASSDALVREDTLRALQEELLLMQFAQATALSPETTLRMDSDIEDQLLSVRAQLSQGNLEKVSDDAQELKTLIRRRNYACGDAAEAQAGIDALTAQIRELNSLNRESVRSVKADAPAAFSAVVDGYEYVLTPQTLAEMTPTAFAAVKPDEAVRSDVGKLISGSTWYYAALLSEADAALLNERDEVTLRFSRGLDFDISMRVERISKAENGRRLVVFSSDRYLAEATLLRRQSAELVLGEYDGIRVPNNALRVLEDEDGGKTTGVYCLVGLTAHFKPVEVLYRGEDYYIVAPVKIESANESRILLYTLRAGDEIIITANDLYDGKVVG